MSGNEHADDRPLILLLDDEPVILIDLKMAAEDAGFRTAVAASAERALAAIEAERPDAAVLDVNLGGGSTCAPVADRLRTLGIPYLIHSGDLDRQGELVRTFDAPIIPKPTPGRYVAEEVKSLLPETGPQFA